MLAFEKPKHYHTDFFSIGEQFYHFYFYYYYMVQLSPSVVQNLLSRLKEDKKPKFGKMTPQQMVEHLCEMFDISTNKIESEVFVASEKLPKWKDFLMSDLPFQPFESPRDKDGLPPLKYANLDDAKYELVKRVEEFNTYYKNHPAARANCPAFGSLSYYEWKKFHGKHLYHHFSQFKLIQ